MIIFHTVFFKKKASNCTYKTFCALCMFITSYTRQKNRSENRQQPLVARDRGWSPDLYIQDEECLNLKL